jgi:hypothetical protein
MAKRRPSDLDAEISRAARQRITLVSRVLQPAEVLATDPAVCVLQQTEPPTPVVVVRDAGVLFATDRRLLYRALNSERRETWPYERTVAHKLTRCTNARLVCALPALARLRGRGWGFATLKFRTADGSAFAVHGSRPFLAMIDGVLGNVRRDTLPRMTTTVAVYAQGASLLRCRDCGTEIAGEVDYCAGCARTFDWDASKQAIADYLSDKATK